MGSRPNDVVVGEKDRRSFLEGFGARSQSSILGHQEIHNDLLISSPITAIRKDKDSLVLNLVEVPRSRVVDLVFGKLSERCGIPVVFYYVTWGDNVFEAISLCHQAAFLAFASSHQHYPIFFGHSSHGCVSADKLTRGDFDLELLAQLHASFLFCLSTAIRDEDIRAENSVTFCRSDGQDLHFDSPFVIATKHLHCLDSLGDGPATPNKDTVNIKTQKHRSLCLLQMAALVACSYQS